jgi:hypothetical protein
MHGSFQDIIIYQIYLKIYKLQLYADILQTLDNIHIGIQFISRKQQIQ